MDREPRFQELTVRTDPILEQKARKAKERISENLHILANEPSLALYRLQENVRKSMVPIIEKRVEAEKLQNALQGGCYDIEYAIAEMKTMQGTIERFKNIAELAKMALFMKQQLKYLQTKKNTKDKDPPGSVYKRLSAHITLDLPDLPEALRETANKVESMMANSRHSTMY